MRYFDLIIYSNVEKFISTLQPKTIAKVLRTIDLLEKFGNQLSMPHSKKIANDLFELRIRGKQEVRIFYTFRQKKVDLIHAYVKKTQRAPQREIKKAFKILHQI